jgi:hypothetical protein
MSSAQQKANGNNLSSHHALFDKSTHHKYGCIKLKYADSFKVKLSLRIQPFGDNLEPHCFIPVSCHSQVHLLL